MNPQQHHSGKVPFCGVTNAVELERRPGIFIGGDVVGGDEVQSTFRANSSDPDNEVVIVNRRIITVIGAPYDPRNPEHHSAYVKAWDDWLVD